jgi:altronate dehydratase
MKINKDRKAIRANEEVEVAPEATALLFETEDVAELVAEATGQVVTADVSEDGDTVIFEVGEGEEAEVFEVSAEGDEEILEASTRVLAGSKKRVQAARRPAKNTPVKASKQIRKVPSKR